MEKKKKGSAISNISICNQTHEYIITKDKNVHVNAKESKQYCWKVAFSCSLFQLKTYYRFLMVYYAKVVQVRLCDFALY